MRWRGRTQRGLRTNRNDVRTDAGAGEAAGFINNL